MHKHTQLSICQGCDKKKVCCEVFTTTGVQEIAGKLMLVLVGKTHLCDECLDIRLGSKQIKS